MDNSFGFKAAGAAAVTVAFSTSFGDNKVEIRDNSTIWFIGFVFIVAVILWFWFSLKA